jgi:hypothetical protein
VKPIVFISSVSEDYQHIRQAAREAISKAGGQPIGFEDFSAQNKSSRNACLEGIRECDVYLAVLGARYGFITSSGLSATEDEFNEAVHLGKRRLVLVEEVDGHEPKQQAFLKRIGDYETGRFWKKFRNTEGLKEELAKTLKEVFLTLVKGLTESQLKERLQKEILNPLENNYSQSWLITAAIPDCQASITDDSSFNDEKFAKKIFLIGQEGDPSVFEIEWGKSKALKEDHWLLEQLGNRHWREEQRFSIVKLYLDACVVIAMNVTGRESEQDYSSSQGLYIYPDTLQGIADTQLSFLTRVYNHLDPHLRWDRVALMSALHHVGHRNFARPRPGQTSHSIPFPFGSSEGPVLAFDIPKILERNQLEQPSYGQTLRAAFERKLKGK